MTRLSGYGGKTSKYNSRKSEMDGIVFDSKREMERYGELRFLQAAGAIHNLEVQVPFELVQPFKGERGVKYIADFVYNEGFAMVVEDVKSAPTRTPVYILKRKLFKIRYPEYEFRETY